jgi:hypothetical protein
MRVAETTAAQAVPPARAVTSVNCAEPENMAIEATTGAAGPHPLSHGDGPEGHRQHKGRCGQPAPMRMPAR